MKFFKFKKPKLKKLRKKQSVNSVNTQILSRKNSLTTRLALTVGLSILIALIVMNSIIIFVTTNAINSTKDEVMLGFSQSNANKIEGTLKATSTIYNSVQTAYDDMKAGILEKGDAGNHVSRVTGNPIDGAEFEAENIIINELTAATELNKNIVGSSLGCVK